MGFDPNLWWRLTANGGHLHPEQLFQGGEAPAAIWVPVLAVSLLLASPFVLLAAVVWLYRPPPHCPRCGGKMRGLFSSLPRREVLRHSCPACGEMTSREGSGLVLF